jgi:L-lactate utilization protein LutC
MGIFDKIFKKKVETSTAKNESLDSQDDLSIDQKFVKKFIQKGGKFLYCADLNETESNLEHILHENDWGEVICFEDKTKDILSKIKVQNTERIKSNLPFFTCCESLIANDGSIMFSSKQLHDKKLHEFSNNFIVFARTSQLVKDTREGISGIRNRSEKNEATIISSIKDFIPKKDATDFMTYGNTNAKTLYLLLLEDL